MIFPIDFKVFFRRKRAFFLQRAKTETFSSSPDLGSAAKEQPGSHRGAWGWQDGLRPRRTAVVKRRKISQISKNISLEEDEFIKAFIQTKVSSCFFTCSEAIAEGLAYKIATSDVPEMLVGPGSHRGKRLSDFWD